MTLRSFLGIFAIFGLWTSVALAEDLSDADRSYRVSDILFEESSSWRRLEDLPSLEPKDLTADLAETLWHVVDGTAPVVTDGKSCHPAIRLFLADDAASHFKKIIFDNGSDHGLIYSGSANCQEGDITIVWHHYRNYASVSAELIYGKIIRIEDAPRPRFTSISVGCCAEEDDEYRLGQMAPYKAGQKYVVAKLMTLPKVSSKDRREVTFQHETSLRLDPKRDDHYDPERSRYEEQAIIGNVIRRYMPGLRATQIAEETSANGEHWKLLFVPEDNNALCNYSSIKANLGWIKE